MSLLRDYAAALAQPTLPLGERSGCEVRRGGRAGRCAAAGVEGHGGDRRRPDPRRSSSGSTARSRRCSPTTARRTAIPRRGSQPWQLDPMPLVLDAATWARLEVGLAQRAELLNALLADLYGEQRLLADGVIPSASCSGTRGFTRPIARARGFDAHPLRPDEHRPRPRRRGRVARARPTGCRRRPVSATRWRTAACCRACCRSCTEESRPAPHGTVLLGAARSAAPGRARRVADPRVVVLSPGTHSETAYDQAFIANTLGFPLVQGSDLVVRDGWVWMKPAGLAPARADERVDVILRRVDAEWCDPARAARRAPSWASQASPRRYAAAGCGSSTVSGAGVLENPGLLPFMPAVCEACSASSCVSRRCPPGGAATPTVWLACWMPSSHEDRRTSSSARSTVARAVCPRSIAAQLRDRILAAPHRFVGQERLAALPGARVGRQRPRVGRATPNPLVLRTFTLRYGAVYRPLVGGLATSSTTAKAAPSTQGRLGAQGRAGRPRPGHRRGRCR